MYQSFTSHGEGDRGAARLAALRARLSVDGLDGFLIPRADVHQGEYVAPGDERLAWATGFTGSAGFAVALADKAALFVDGRYTLQAATQTDPSAWETIPSAETTPADWLAAHAPEGARIGFDPWLHGRDETRRLEKALAGKNAALVALKANPLDALWEGRPPPPAAAIHPHPEDFAGEASAQKRRRLAALLSADDIAAAVITLPDSVAWLLNIRGEDIPRMPAPLTFAILHAGGGATLFAREGQCDQALRDHLGPDVHILDRRRFRKALKALAPGRVALDPATAPVAVARVLEKAGAEIVWRADPCILPKAIKNETEIAGARAAHLRDGAAMARFLHWLDRKAPTGGLTEIAIVKRLEKERRATNMLRDISFDTIAGAGPNGAIVHYRVSRETDRTLATGELMLIDSGGQYPDGTTDITRTIACGPPPEDAAAAFTRVLKGMIAISRLRFPKGLAGRDIDGFARAALWRAGLDYDHGTGHGVGSYLSVHEGPQRIARAGEAKLAPGMIVSNEPGYYREGAFGIRIENLLVVAAPETPAGGERPMLGFETLTLAPIDRRLIDPALLDADERAWLDAYHARVMAEIGPLLDEGDRAWLAAATAPL